MKALIIGSFHCHLERLTMQILHDLGIRSFCTGKYLDPSNPRFDSLAEPLDIGNFPNLINEFNKLNPRQGKWKKPRLSPAFVNSFDFVITQHCGPITDYIQGMWEQIKHKPVIHMTYGLETPAQEEFCRQQKAKGAKLYMLRFSEKESCIQNYAGCDGAILPWIDEEAYQNWNGNNKTCVTFQNWYGSRRKYEFAAYATHDRVLSNFDHAIHGIDTPGGLVSPKYQKQLYENSRVYFGLGTVPSPITINIFEALMTGMPVVTWGYKYGQNPSIPQYQMPEIITNYENGLCSDDEAEITAFIQRCMDDHDYAKVIGTNARLLALKTFSRSVAKLEWQKFLTRVGILS